MLPKCIANYSKIAEITESDAVNKRYLNTRIASGIAQLSTQLLYGTFYTYADCHFHKCILNLLGRSVGSGLAVANALLQLCKAGC